MVRILKPWLCGGRLPEVGKTVELPKELAGSGIERGLCTAAKPRRRSTSGRTQAEKSKRKGYN